MGDEHCYIIIPRSLVKEYDAERYRIDCGNAQDFVKMVLMGAINPGKAVVMEEKEA